MEIVQTSRPLFYRYCAFEQKLNSKWSISFSKLNLGGSLYRNLHKHYTGQLEHIVDNNSQL